MWTFHVLTPASNPSPSSFRGVVNGSLVARRLAWMLNQEKLPYKVRDSVAVGDANGSIEQTTLATHLFSRAAGVIPNVTISPRLRIQSHTTQRQRNSLMIACTCQPQLVRRDQRWTIGSMAVCQLYLVCVCLAKRMTLSPRATDRCRVPHAHSARLPTVKRAQGKRSYIRGISLLRHLSNK